MRKVAGALGTGVAAIVGVGALLFAAFAWSAWMIMLLVGGLYHTFGFWQPIGFWGAVLVALALSFVSSFFRGNEK